MRITRRTWLGFALVGVLIGGALIGWWRLGRLLDHRRLVARLDDPAPAVREKTLSILGSERDPALLERFRTIACDDDNGWVRRAAVSAILKTRGPDAVDEIAAAIEREPPGPVVGDLVELYARAAGPDEAARRWAGRLDGWGDLGVAAQRLRSGDDRGADELFAMARSADQPNQRAYAAAALVRSAIRVMETLGNHLPLPDPNPAGFDAATLDRFQTWWRRVATPKVLADIYDRQTDPSWRASEFVRFLRLKNEAADVFDTD